MNYRLITTRGNYYTLDDEGRVTARSNGPEGWNYSGKWQIIGIGKRVHSARLISLEDAAQGADFGQGWVHDLDHGTHRMWGMERIRSIVQT